MRLDSKDKYVKAWIEKLLDLFNELQEYWMEKALKEADKKCCRKGENKWLKVKQ